ncbi:MAG: hypothetical protein JKY37_24135, partial [Nannocystaceae bacterium]|nr:hypothetical protein [Nannocystaceae bacterium]
MPDTAASTESASSAAVRPWTRGAVAWVGVVMVLAVVVYWPALQVRYFADDYIQIAKLEGLLGPHHPAGLYSFFADNPAEILAHRARGSLPWWTVDDFRFVHVRPLASLLLELDHAIAPRAAWLHHLHSMGWLLAMLGTLALVLRRSTTPAIAAGALLIFALDETLAWTVAWVANRCAMITATFVFGALAVHMKRRDNPSPRWWWAELVCWLVALSAGEYAVRGLA